MATLDFAWLHRPAEQLPTSDLGVPAYRTKRNSLDFVIDGQSLYTTLSAEERDLVGVLGWAPLEEDELAVKRLLLQIPTNLWDNRQSLFVCPECGDIGCGAITANVSGLGEHYVWKDFAYENNYDQAMTDRESFAHVGPFVFKRDEYVNALRGALEIRRT